MGLIALLKTFDRYFVIDSGNDDISRSGIRRAVNSEQIAIEDAALDHTVTSDDQHIVCCGLKKRRRYLAVILNMCFGENWISCGDPANNRQA